MELRPTINASELHRIMGCGGYLGIGALESADAVTDERREGIAAHGLVQLVLTGVVSSADELIDRNIHGHIVTGEMVEYLTPVIEHIQRRNLSTATEAVVDWTTANAFIKGRADIVSFDPATATLFIDDLKYGWKIVEPEMNWQLIAYAIGALFTFGWQPHRIVFTIYQPRPFHGNGTMREWIIDNAAIQNFYHQINARFESLPNTVTTGPHCYKCDRAAACPAARQAALAAVDVTLHTYHENLTDLQISYELDLLERAGDALKVRTDALKSLATSKGGVPGWALKQSQGNRKWIEGTDAETIAMLGGVDVAKLQKSSLITPAQAEKAGLDKTIAAAFTERASTGFKLVRADTDKDAKKLFNPQ
jgi:hypothetical protein